MTFRLIFGLLAAYAVLMGWSGSAVAACDATGSEKYICGPTNSEDLIQVPGTHWVIGSGLAEGDHPQGSLYLLDTRDHSAKVLYPAAGVHHRLDAKTYDACPGAPDAKTFSAHGINLRRQADGKYKLYVVHHGGRDSVEVFDLDAKGARPGLTWVGCAVMPAGMWPNAVASLPGSGFAVTNMFNPADPKFADKLYAGENTGSVVVWEPRKGWSVVPGSEMSGNNGIEASADGKWLYVAGWGNETLARMSRSGKGQPEVIKTGFHTDNLRWGADGSLYAAGQGGTAQDIFACFASKNAVCSNPFTVMKVDPKTLKTEEVLHDAGNPAFGGGTTGLKVGNEVWVGTFRGDRIAVFPAQ